MKQRIIPGTLLVMACAAVAGCGKKAEAPAAPVNWTSAAYHISTTYPGSWKLDDAGTMEDPKTGKVVIVVFQKPDEMSTGKVTERSPFVKITWTPLRAGQDASAGGPATLETAPESAPTVMGVPASSSGLSAGWTEFGADDIKTRTFSGPEGYPAEEATATAKPGTAFFATYTGQLAGSAQSVRMVGLKLPTGTYEVTRICPSDSPELTKEGDMIVDSLKVTR